MTSPLASILLAFLGYSLLNVGQAGQKIGLAFRHRRRVSGWLVWTGATLATSASFIFVFIAISMGSVAVVGAMSGTGLVSLALFSAFVMKEGLARRDIAAIALIVGGAAAMGFGAPQSSGEEQTVLLYVILLGGTMACAALWVALRRRAVVGMVIGGFAGFLGAYSQLFQKLGTQELSISAGISPFLRSVISDPITAVWVVLSLASMVVIQFSYRHAKAIQIIPIFTASFIIVPAVGGLLVFGEALGLHQWLGIAVMIPGSVLLSRRVANRDYAQ